MGTQRATELTDTAGLSEERIYDSMKVRMGVAKLMKVSAETKEKCDRNIQEMYRMFKNAAKKQNHAKSHQAEGAETIGVIDLC